METERSGNQATHLLQKTSFYRQIVETADFGIGIVDLSGRYIYVNSCWSLMTGYSHSELLSLGVPDLTVPEDIKVSREYISALGAGRIPMYTLEKRFRRKTGGVFWGRLVATPIRNEAGRIVAINGLIADITPLKESLSKLKRFSALHQVHARINALLLDFPDISEFIPAFARALTLGTPFSSAEVYRFDQGRQSFLPFSDFPRPPAKCLGTRLREAWDSGKPRIAREDQESGKGSVFSGLFPIFSGPSQKETDPWGILLVSSPDEGSFHPEVIPLIETLSGTLSRVLEAHGLSALHLRAEATIDRIRNTYGSLLEISTLASGNSDNHDFVAGVVRILGKTGRTSLVTAFVLGPSEGWVEPVLLMGDGMTELHFPEGQVPALPLPDPGQSIADLLPHYLERLGWETWANRMDHSGSLFTRHVPLHRRGVDYGVISISSFDSDFFEKDFLSLIGETGRIVSNGLDSRDRERERRDLEDRQIKLAHIHQALHKLHQLVSEGPKVPELLRGACRILFEVGQTTEAGFYFPLPGENRLTLVCYMGKTESREPFSYPSSFSVDPGDLESQTITSRSFLLGEPVHSNNLPEEYRHRGLDSLATHFENLSWKSAGVFPVRRGTSLYALMAVVSKEGGFFDRDMILLLEEFARTVTYALNSLDLEESRQASEKNRKNLTALYEALHRINRLIEVRPDPRSLFEETCEILVSRGGLLDASVLLFDQGREALIPEVIRSRSGDPDRKILHDLSISTSRDHPDGLTGMVRAFRSGTPVVNQDFSLNFAKPEFSRLSELGHLFGWKSGASFPIFLPDPEGDRSTIGVLAVTSGEAGFFHENLVTLLLEASHGISLALRQHREEEVRKGSEEKLVKISELYAALHGINRLVIHRPDESTLFEETCRIVTEIGMLYLARILRVDPSGEEIHPVAVHGRDKRTIPFFRELSYLAREDPEGKFRNLSPQACLRKRHPVIHHNLVKELDSMGLGVLSAKAMEFGLWSQASFPVFRSGEPAFILSVFAEKVAFFDKDLVLLLDKVSQSLSHALDNIDRDLKRQVAEEDLRRSEEKYRLLIKEAIDGILILAVDTDCVIDANRSAARLFGIPECDLVGKKRSELFPEASGSPSAGSPFPTLGNPRGETAQAGPVRYHLTDGPEPPREVEVIESALSWQDQNLLQVRLRDITELHFYETELEKLAQHDSLTGLLNRHAFEIRLDRIANQASVSGSGFALFYIDLDDFKITNDTHGHDVGDRLLVDVATRLRGSVRENDLVARIGGDEFLILVEESLTHERATQIAKKILFALNTPSRGHDLSIPVHASIGIGFFPEDGINPGPLLQAADKAMYRAKRNGRNRYSFLKDPDTD